MENSDVFEVSPVPIVRYDPESGVVSTNSALDQLLEGAAADQDRLSLILPTDYLSILKNVARDLKARVEKKDYDGRSLQSSFVPAKGGGHVFVFVTDIMPTEVEDSLLQTDKMASLGLLVAGVAHEINTPMGAIHSNNDILSRSIGKMRRATETEPPEDIARILTILEDVCRNNTLATERILSIVQNLKNFARLDEAERKRVNIHEGLDSTLMLAHHQFKKGIHIVKRYGSLPEIECFPNQLNQVFMNLLVNAAQAVGEHGTITIETSQQDDSVMISISDTGIGIPAENLGKVFDPGFTTKGVGVGTGLGLSISYKIVQNHGGKIAVESDAGKGSTFMITLPLTAPEENHGG